MKYRLAILLFSLELMVVLPVMAQTKAPSPEQPKTPAAAQAEQLPVLGVPEGYEYLPRGRRDPFVNPIPKPIPPPPGQEAPKEPARPGGLKGAAVDEVALSGVFVSRSEPSMSRAILVVPGLRAPVIASIGDELFDAVIKEIRPDSVVFSKRASAGKPGTAGGEEIKKLRSSAGDKK